MASYRGLLYSELKETDKAIADLEQALALGLEPELKQVAESVLQELK